VIRRLRSVRPVRGEGGYSLIELLTVMAIMGIVMGGLTQIFVSGSKAEVDMNVRFQAQLNARLALDKIRRDVHCASDVTGYTTTSTSQTATLNLPGACGGNKTYCTAAVGSSTTRYALYWRAGSSCSSSTGTKLIDYLTTYNVFPAFNHVAGCGCLASLQVDFPVSINGGAIGKYELQDTLYLRNSTRI
jgi:prepilin-type N-terminal cleavage/methylation domain-containing protein